MNAKKEKAIEVTRSLYCEVNASGAKKYTLRDIVKLLKQKCKYETSIATISRWIDKYNWEDTFIKLKQAGIEQAQGDITNKIIDEKASTIADIYKGNKTIQKVSNQTIIARLLAQPVKDKDGNEIKSEITNRDLISLLQHSETTILNLHDKKTDSKVLDLAQFETDDLIARAEAARLLEKSKK
jgi:hypothetical protein